MKINLNLSRIQSFRSNELVKNQQMTSVTAQNEPQKKTEMVQTAGENVKSADINLSDSNNQIPQKEQAQNVKKLKYDRDTIIEHNPLTSAKIAGTKTLDSFTVYPVKGLNGDKNFNFYEFLSLGIVPYLIGSAGFISVFNLANKYFQPAAKFQADKIGNKMGLGVLFYGLAKWASKKFVSAPVHALTGVDTELPYARVVENHPKFEGDKNTKTIEYHKVFESVEFPRFDLLDRDKNGNITSEYYDKVAKKLGLGDKLNDSRQEVQPRIRDIISRSTAAKNLSSYLWAATGVGFAFQTPWEDFFVSFKQGQGMDKVKNIARAFGKCSVDAIKSLWNGGVNPTKLTKCAGKILLGSAVASTVLGVVNVVSNARKSPKLENEKVFDSNRKVVVD